MFGLDISEKKYKELDIKYVVIQPKLKGGSSKIGFLNVNGIPSGNKNLHKYRDLENFMKGNDTNVFIETGCTTKKPKPSHTRWEVCQNNGVEKEKNYQYIHNGKGTAIIKNYKTKT